MSSVFAMISDSCNSMRDVRKSLQDDHIIKYAYGYSAHCVNNLTLDLYKQGEFPDTIKKALYISKKVKNVGMIRKIFENVCEERLGKVLGMVLYSLTRWKSVNYMFLNVRYVCLDIIHVL